MKLHSEISIGRLVFYLSFLLSLSGGSIGERDLSDAVDQYDLQIESTKSCDLLTKDRHDTCIGRLENWDSTNDK